MNTAFNKNFCLRATRYSNYFPALCELWELFCLVFQWISSPGTVPLWNCTLHVHRLIFNQSLKRTTKKTYALPSSLLSRTLLLKTEPFCWSRTPTPIFASSTQWGQRLYLGSPSLHWDLKIASQEESWAIKGLTSFAPHLWGITVLYCLLFNTWKSLFHVFCPVS